MVSGFSVLNSSVLASLIRIRGYFWAFTQNRSLKYLSNISPPSRPHTLPLPPQAVKLILRPWTCPNFVTGVISQMRLSLLFVYRNSLNQVHKCVSFSSFFHITTGNCLTNYFVSYCIFFKKHGFLTVFLMSTHRPWRSWKSIPSSVGAPCFCYQLWANYSLLPNSLSTLSGFFFFSFYWKHFFLL